MSASPKPLIRSIGMLKSCFKEKFGTPRQPNLVPSSRATLKIKADFIPEQSLKGLSEFSHVWLLAYFHLNTNKIFLSTVHPPRLKGKTVGVFASRAPHRPSPIGLSLARLVRVHGDTLELAEVDLVDGTPILDVKPYIPSYDAVPLASGRWTVRADKRELSVEFVPEALEHARRHDLEPIIREVLRQDLRNPRDSSQMKDGKVLGFFVFDWDVHYAVHSGVARVLDIVPAEEHKKKRTPPTPAELE